MAKRHWYTGLRGACKVPRTLLGWWYEIKPRDFLDRHALEPDRYCSDCAKAARLALAAESAPKPSDVVWPKPRPIEEAPHAAILAWCPATEELTEGWEVVYPSNQPGWWCGNGELHQPTHFLPLPPEVK